MSVIRTGVLMCLLARLASATTPVDVIATASHENISGGLPTFWIANLAVGEYRLTVFADEGDNLGQICVTEYWQDTFGLHSVLSAIPVEANSTRAFESWFHVSSDGSAGGIILIADTTTTGCTSPPSDYSAYVVLERLH